MDEKQYVKQNRALLTLIKSKGWEIVKEKMFNRIQDLQSIMNLENVKEQDLVTEVKVRGLVVKELINWMQEVEGEAMQFNANTNTIIPLDEGFHIQREDVPEE